VQLASRVTLVGQLVDVRTSRPIAGVSMYASLEGGGLPTWIPSDLRNMTDATGHFEIPNIGRGAIAIDGGTHDEGGQQMSPVTVYRTITSSDPAVIDLGQVRAVTTSVHMPSGNPGFDLEASNGVTRVTAVVPDGAADRAGLVVGDVIIAIDGVDVTGPASRAASQLLNGDPGTTVVLDLERGVTSTIVLGP
jgi:hypothetical protein